jgi:hypothetical protein
MESLNWAVGIFTILGNLALVVSVLLVLREVRRNLRLTRAANSQTMVELAGPFFLGMVQNRELMDLYVRGAADFESLDEVDRRRHRNLLIWWLIFYENVFYQRRLKFLDRHAFQPWWRDLQRFVLEQNLHRQWDELKDLFQEEFAAAVSALIAETTRQQSGPASPT